MILIFELCKITSFGTQLCTILKITTITFQSKHRSFPLKKSEKFKNPS